jgi:hypothetical protein
VIIKIKLSQEGAIAPLQPALLSRVSKEGTLQNGDFCSVPFFYGKLSPTSPVPRAEMAQVLYNLLGKKQAKNLLFFLPI